MESNEDGFSLNSELQNITKIAAGIVNGAIDHQGALFTWYSGG